MKTERKEEKEVFRVSREESREEKRKRSEGKEEEQSECKKAEV